MEQHLAPYNIECMKMAMLKHEEVFKQQVQELHRLYRIQKTLMKTSQRRIPKNDLPRSNEKHMRNFLRDLERPSGDCFNGEPRVCDFDNRDDAAPDLTLGLGIYNRVSQESNKKLSPTRLTSDSVMSFSSSSTGSSSHFKKACVVGGRTDMVEYQKQLGQQDRAMGDQPPLLMQVLSLNMT